MLREPVNSSSIKSIGYSSDDKELEVEFKTGDVYLYYNIPQIVYRQLITADSIGSAFHFLIREADYSYTKI